jgi:hypothetical protein
LEFQSFSAKESATSCPHWCSVTYLQCAVLRYERLYCIIASVNIAVPLYLRKMRFIWKKFIHNRLKSRILKAVNFWI